MVGAGAVAGVLSAGVLWAVNRAVHVQGNVPVWLLTAFVAVAAGKIISNATAQLLLGRFSQNIVLELSLTLCAKILNAPLALIEKRGSASILATLTDDVASVTWTIQSLPQLAMNIATVAGCGCYLLWLSPKMFALVFVVAVIGTLVYRVLHGRAVQRIIASREARANLFEHFRSLMLGIKELMMHRDRRDSMLADEIHPAADEYRTENLAATTQYVMAEAWVQVLYHSLIALVLFSFARPSEESLTGYIFTMIYMMTPLWGILSAWPTLARGQVALAKIEELSGTIDQATVPPPSPVPIHRDAPVIEMDQVTFTYQAKAGKGEADHGFSLGPVNFKLAAGELVFVVGGNGSGKSTFVKVLMGLYAPTTGQISMGGTLVTEDSREWYREHFSAVFPDCFVFEKLLGLSAPDLAVKTQQYLELLQIQHKVALREGPRGLAFSTVDLSTGQRKRLALVTAYLEDRPFYVFDEWAADQDPEYKRIFYSTLLPDLRNRGKAVVVITHDDRYFHMGDRVVKLEDGKIVADHAPVEVPADSPVASLGASTLALGAR